ncbi:MAG: hypothetical protein AAGF72_14460, partial [Pseudomonadota bacterium]
MTAVWDLRDPFAAARREAGALLGDFDDEAIALVLRYHDVRGAATDHATFTSDTPFRVPIPSEESVREVRQLPIETDPPSHARYRAVVREIFSRPRQPGFVRAIEQLVEEMVASVADGAAFDVVNAFALPLQSKALAILLGMPTEDAELWATWGQNIFHSDDALDEQKGGELDRYLRQQFERAERSPGDDFFSALTSEGRDTARAALVDEVVEVAGQSFERRVSEQGAQHGSVPPWLRATWAGPPDKEATVVPVRAATADPPCARENAARTVRDSDRRGSGCQDDSER